MAKFIFKMENILEVKRKLEDQAKSMYASALAVLDEEQQRLALLEQKREGYKERLTSIMTASLNIDQIKTLEDAVEVMKYRIREQMVRVQDAEIKAERARQALQEAMVERKTYEKLKEKAFEEFKLEINAQEKKEVDELVSFTYSKS